MKKGDGERRNKFPTPFSGRRASSFSLVTLSSPIALRIFETEFFLHCFTNVQQKKTFEKGREEKAMFRAGNAFFLLHCISIASFIFHRRIEHRLPLPILYFRRRRSKRLVFSPSPTDCVTGFFATVVKCTLNGLALSPLDNRKTINKERERKTEGRQANRQT